MMLTAGLGVSEMMIGWDNVALELGGVTPVVLSKDAVDIPLTHKRRMIFNVSPRADVTQQKTQCMHCVESCI